MLRQSKHLGLGAACFRRVTCVRLAAVTVAMVLVYVIALNGTFTGTNPVLISIPTILETVSDTAHMETMDRFDRRREELQEVCSQINTTSSRTVRLTDSTAANLSVCIVQKADSYVWIQLLKVLEGEEVDATEQRSANNWHVRHRYRNELKSHYVYEGQNTSMTHTIKVMTVRDPYTRIWSAYLDQFLLPFICEDGQTIIEHYRPNATDSALTCGYDVTFPEFIEFVIAEGHSEGSCSSHWLPASDICDPCRLDPEFIVKHETIKPDVQAVVVRLGLFGRVDIFNNTGENTLEDDIAGHILDFEVVKDCLNETEYLEKLWYELVVNGYIPPSTDIHDNFIHTKLDTSALLDLVTTVQTRYGIDNQMRRELRQQALVQAYKQLPKKQIRALQKLYKLDFTMFNYDMKPPT